MTELNETTKKRKAAFKIILAKATQSFVYSGDKLLDDLIEQQSEELALREDIPFEIIQEGIKLRKESGEEFYPKNVFAFLKYFRRTDEKRNPEEEAADRAEEIASIVMGWIPRYGVRTRFDDIAAQEGMSQEEMEFFRRAIGCWPGSRSWEEWGRISPSDSRRQIFNHARMYVKKVLRGEVPEQPSRIQIEHSAQRLEITHDN